MLSWGRHSTDSRSASVSTRHSSGTTILLTPVWLGVSDLYSSWRHSKLTLLPMISRLLFPSKKGKTQRNQTFLTTKRLEYWIVTHLKSNLQPRKYWIRSSAGLALLKRIGSCCANRAKTSTSCRPIVITRSEWWWLHRVLSSSYWISISQTSLSLRSTSSWKTSCKVWTVRLNTAWTLRCSMSISLIKSLSSRTSSIVRAHRGPLPAMKMIFRLIRMVAKIMSTR